MNLDLLGSLLTAVVVLLIGTLVNRSVGLLSRYNRLVIPQHLAAAKTLDGLGGGAAPVKPGGPPAASGARAQ